MSGKMGAVKTRDAGLCSPSPPRSPSAALVAFAKPVIEAGMGSLHTVGCGWAPAMLILLPIASGAGGRTQHRCCCSGTALPLAGAQAALRGHLENPGGRRAPRRICRPGLRAGVDPVRRSGRRTAAVFGAVPRSASGRVVEIWSGGRFDPVACYSRSVQQRAWRRTGLLSRAAATTSTGRGPCLRLIIATVVLGLISQAWNTPWACWATGAGRPPRQRAGAAAARLCGGGHDRDPY